MKRSTSSGWFRRIVDGRRAEPAAAETVVDPDVVDATPEEVLVRKEPSVRNTEPAGEDGAGADYDGAAVRGENSENHEEAPVETAVAPDPESAGDGGLDYSGRAPAEQESQVQESENATSPAPFSIDDSPIAREIADLTSRRKVLDGVQLQFGGKTRIITVSNQKGGVGKTTTTVNVAAALASVGARVLVIDLDPQGNASTALGVPHSAEVPSVYDVLIDEFPLADIIQVSPESPLLLCAPSTIHLAGAEIELVSQVAREHRLKTAVDDYLSSTEEHLDFILIDCPPSLGLLTINAFTAAEELMIPIQCEYYALEGLSQLLGSVRMIQKHLNPGFHLSTIVLTMYDGRTRLAQQVAEEVRTHFGTEVLDTVIPRSVRVSEAPSFGQTVIAYDGQSAGAVAYREAAVEIARRGLTEQPNEGAS